jgi:anti-sigma factor RsiW
MSSAPEDRRADVTCEQLTTFIADYLAGELDAETTSAFEQHLRDCSDCVPFLNAYRKTIDAIRSLRDADIPPELADRVGRFLQQRQSGTFFGKCC